MPTLTGHTNVLVQQAKRQMQHGDSLVLAGEYEKSIRQFRKAIILRESTLLQEETSSSSTSCCTSSSRYHADTATIFDRIGDSHYELEEYMESIHAYSTGVRVRLYLLYNDTNKKHQKTEQQEQLMLDLPTTLHDILQQKMGLFEHQIKEYNHILSSSVQFEWKADRQRCLGVYSTARRYYTEALAKEQQLIQMVLDVSKNPTNDSISSITSKQPTSSIASTVLSNFSSTSTMAILWRKIACLLGCGNCALARDSKSTQEEDEEDENPADNSNNSDNDNTESSGPTPTGIDWNEVDCIHLATNKWILQSEESVLSSQEQEEEILHAIQKGDFCYCQSKFQRAIECYQCANEIATTGHYSGSCSSSSASTSSSSSSSSSSSESSSDASTSSSSSSGSSSSSDAISATSSSSSSASSSSSSDDEEEDDDDDDDDSSNDENNTGAMAKPKKPNKKIATPSTTTGDESEIAATKTPIPLQEQHNKVKDPATTRMTTKATVVNSSDDANHEKMQQRLEVRVQSPVKEKIKIPESSSYEEDVPSSSSSEEEADSSSTSSSSSSEEEKVVSPSSSSSSSSEEKKVVSPSSSSSSSSSSSEEEKIVSPSSSSSEEEIQLCASSEYEEASSSDSSNGSVNDKIANNVDDGPNGKRKSKRKTSTLSIETPTASMSDSSFNNYDTTAISNTDNTSTPIDTSTPEFISPSSLSSSTSSSSLLLTEAKQHLFDGDLRCFEEKYIESIEEYQTALQLREAILGRYHPDCIEVYDHIGESYYNQGTNDEMNNIDNDDNTAMEDHFNKALLAYCRSLRGASYLYQLAAMVVAVNEDGGNDNDDNNDNSTQRKEYKQRVLQLKEDSPYHYDVKKYKRIPELLRYRKGYTPAHITDYINSTIHRSVQFEVNGDIQRTLGDIEAAKQQYQTSIKVLRQGEQPPEEGEGTQNSKNTTTATASDDATISHLWCKIACLLFYGKIYYQSTGGEAYNDKLIDWKQLDRIHTRVTQTTDSMGTDMDPDTVDILHVIQSGDRCYLESQYQKAIELYQLASAKAATKVCVTPKQQQHQQHQQEKLPKQSEIEPQKEYQQDENANQQNVGEKSETRLKDEVVDERKKQKRKQKQKDKASQKVDEQQTVKQRQRQGLEDEEQRKQQQQLPIIDQKSMIHKEETTNNKAVTAASDRASNRKNSKLQTQKQKLFQGTDISGPRSRKATEESSVVSVSSKKSQGSCDAESTSTKTSSTVARLNKRKQEWKQKRDKQESFTPIPTSIEETKRCSSPESVSTVSTNWTFASSSSPNGNAHFTHKNGKTVTSVKPRTLSQAKRYMYNGDSLCLAGNFKESILEFKRALVIKEALIGRNKLETADIYDRIGDASHDMEDFDASLVAYRASLRINRYLNENNSTNGKKDVDNMKPDMNHRHSYLSEILEERKGLFKYQLKEYDRNLSSSVQSEKEGDEQRSIGQYESAMQHYKDAIAAEESALGNDATLAFLWRKIACLLFGHADRNKKATNNVTDDGCNSAASTTNCSIDWSQVDCIHEVSKHWPSFKWSPANGGLGVILEESKQQQKPEECLLQALEYGDTCYFEFQYLQAIEQYQWVSGIIKDCFDLQQQQQQQLPSEEKESAFVSIEKDETGSMEGEKEKHGAESNETVSIELEENKDRKLNMTSVKEELDKKAKDKEEENDESTKLSDTMSTGSASTSDTARNLERSFTPRFSAYERNFSKRSSLQEANGTQRFSLVSTVQEMDITLNSLSVSANTAAKDREKLKSNQQNLLERVEEIQTSVAGLKSESLHQQDLRAQIQEMRDAIDSHGSTLEVLSESIEAASLQRARIEKNQEELTLCVQNMSSAMNAMFTNMNEWMAAQNK